MCCNSKTSLGCRVVNNSLWLAITIHYFFLSLSILVFWWLALCPNTLDVGISKIIFIEILGQESFKGYSCAGFSYLS